MRADHDRVESIFSAAVAKGAPAERSRYLDGACRNEPHCATGWSSCSRPTMRQGAF